MQKIEIKTEFITLGQLLKIANIVDSGGAAKYFLLEHSNDFEINGENDSRRGRKLYSGDAISIKKIGDFLISKWY